MRMKAALISGGSSNGYDKGGEAKSVVKQVRMSDLSPDLSPECSAIAVQRIRCERGAIGRLWAPTFAGKRADFGCDYYRMAETIVMIFA